MNKKVIIAIVAVLVLGGVAAVYLFPKKEEEIILPEPVVQVPEEKEKPVQEKKEEPIKEEEKDEVLETKEDIKVINIPKQNIEILKQVEEETYIEPIPQKEEKEPEEKEPVNITFDEYTAYSDDQKMEFISNSFETYDDFLTWFDENKAIYDQGKEPVEIDQNTTGKFGDE